MNINENTQKYLIHLAKKSIQTVLEIPSNEMVQPKDDILLQYLGAFVTIESDHQLRGCIGNMIGRKPLNELIPDLAIQAAFHDPRFEPISKDEFHHIGIEISILSPLFHVQNDRALQTLEIGKHGIFLTSGRRSGVLLPQVAVEHHFSKEIFLEQTCSKAGLPPLSWKDSQTHIEFFTATLIHDVSECAS